MQQIFISFSLVDYAVGGSNVYKYSSKSCAWYKLPRFATQSLSEEETEFKRNIGRRDLLLFLFCFKDNMSIKYALCYYRLYCHFTEINTTTYQCQRGGFLLKDTSVQTIQSFIYSAYRSSTLITGYYLRLSYVLGNSVVPILTWLSTYWVTLATWLGNEAS